MVHGVKLPKKPINMDGKLNKLDLPKKETETRNPLT
jgi:hypothetical protein